MGTSDDKAGEAFAIFQDKVKRTVFIDNLSPLASASVVQTALSQFGKVRRVSFIPNYLEHQEIPRCALVEMENPCQADAVIFEISSSPFMISGMPRPVRALLARGEMFSDRPRDPERKLVAGWLDPSDPKFEVCQKVKHLAGKHAAESATLLKYQLEEEEKLEQEQRETLRANYKKYEMIEKLFKDGSVHHLAKYYNMRIADFE